MALKTLRNIPDTFGSPWREAEDVSTNGTTQDLSPGNMPTTALRTAGAPYMCVTLAGTNAASKTFQVEMNLWPAKHQAGILSNKIKFTLGSGTVAYFMDGQAGSWSGFFADTVEPTGGINHYYHTAEANAGACLVWVPTLEMPWFSAKRVGGTGARSIVYAKPSFGPPDLIASMPFSGPSITATGTDVTAGTSQIYSFVCVVNLIVVENRHATSKLFVRIGERDGGTNLDGGTVDNYQVVPAGEARQFLVSSDTIEIDTDSGTLAIGTDFTVSGWV